MKIQTNNYPSIEQAAAQYLSTNQTSQAVSGQEKGRSFAEILSEKSNDNTVSASGITFSKHAAERLNDRNIELSDKQLERLNAGTKEAGDKGINSSLVMVDDLAFIVNTKSNTVVTAMDPGNSDKNVFTNIDGAVIA